MTRKLFLFILLVYSTILFSAEVTLRSENTFICDILEDNPDSVLILFKDQKYKIPRSEILTVNPELSGKHISYQNTILTLEDGNIVKGQLAEETPNLITLKKGTEFLAIPRQTIVIYKKGENKDYSLLDPYKISEIEKKTSSWTWGFYGLAFRNGYIVRDVNYASYGGGFFVEPSFGKLSDRFLFGFQTEYFSAGGQLSYSFFQNFLYLQFNHTLLGLNLYSKLGLGTSYIMLSENGNSATALRGVGTFESGWQHTFNDKYLLRVGVRINGVAATSGIVDMIGIQVSLGYRL